MGIIPKDQPLDPLRDYGKLEEQYNAPRSVVVRPEGGDAYSVTMTPGGKEAGPRVPTGERVPFTTAHAQAAGLGMQMLQAMKAIKDVPQDIRVQAADWVAGAKAGKVIPFIGHNGADLLDALALAKAPDAVQAYWSKVINFAMLAAPLTYGRGIRSPLLANQLLREYALMPGETGPLADQAKWQNMLGAVRQARISAGPAWLPSLQESGINEADIPGLSKAEDLGSTYGVPKPPWEH